jgi:hypothetical protein
MSNGLEKEFKELMQTVGAEIQRLVKEAEASLSKATELADKHGIPFDAPVSHLAQAYIPTSFTQKFGALDPDVVEELTNVSSYSLEDGFGWEHSDVC